jgi:hypothetical protein
LVAGLTIAPRIRTTAVSGYPLQSSPGRLPVAAIFDQSVCQVDVFAHDDDNGVLWRVSDGDEVIALGLEVRLEETGHMAGI